MSYPSRSMGGTEQVHKIHEDFSDAELAALRRLVLIKRRPIDQELADELHAMGHTQRLVNVLRRKAKAMKLRIPSKR